MMKKRVVEVDVAALQRTCSGGCMMDGSYLQHQHQQHQMEQWGWKGDGIGGVDGLRCMGSRH